MGLKTEIVVRALLINALGIPCGWAAPVFLFSDTPYASLNDSPFLQAGTAPVNLFVEDFEDRTVSTPGLALSGGFLSFASHANTDSVDGDDGTLDGTNTSAIGSAYWIILNNVVNISFDAGTLGGYPTHAGLVWTDGGENNVPAGAPGTYLLEAFGSSGQLLGSSSQILGDHAFTRETSEDRFLGVIDPEGISALRLTYVDGPATPYFEIDHVQYGGVPVPVPPAVALMGVVILLPACRRIDT